MILPTWLLSALRSTIIGAWKVLSGVLRRTCALDVERGRARGMGESASLLHDAERERDSDECVSDY